VLVVDDEIDSRDMVENLLKGAGALVSTAGSASEAFDRLLASRPDVLVCDIGMKKEDGYSLIRRLRLSIQEESIPCPSSPKLTIRRRQKFLIGPNLHL
jgi:CheY-like chemotaxis protein